MAIYKTATGSVGTDGTPIYDVFEDQRKLELPEFQQRGLNIDQIQVGQAPTGFVSQFQPVSLDVKDEVPNAALEGGITRGDIDTMFRENQTNFQAQIDSQNNINQDLFNQTLARLQLSPAEKSAQERLLGLQQLQQEAVERVQERPLGGTILKGGLQSEIQNITTGNTRESLVNLRQQAFETQRLQLAQSQRQQELETLKLQLDQGNINTDNLFKAQQLIQQNQSEYLDRVQTLTENARTSLATILDRFQGLTLDKISGESLKTITTLAAQAGIPLDILRDGMQTIADQIAWEQKQKEFEAQTARYKATIGDKESEKTSSQIETLNTKVNLIDSLIDHPGMTGTTGVYGIARWTPFSPDKAEKQQFISGVSQLISQETLGTLLNLKAQGGTLGALSDGERRMLQEAATKIGTWEMRNDDDKVTGYEIDEASMKAELNEIKRLANLAIQKAGGTVNLGQDDINEINTIFGVGGTSGGSFDPSVYFK